RRRQRERGHEGAPRARLVRGLRTSMEGMEEGSDHESPLHHPVEHRDGRQSRLSAAGRLQAHESLRGEPRLLADPARRLRIRIHLWNAPQQEWREWPRESDSTRRDLPLLAARMTKEVSHEETL